MTSCLSPFRWREYPRPSIFCSDPAFCKGASRGLTMGAIQSAAMHRFEKRENRSAGTIPGLNEQVLSHAPRTRWAGSKA